MGGLGPDDLSVRRLTEEDLDLLLELARGEGWGYDRADGERFLRLGGGYVAEAGGRPVGCLTASVYRRLAWVGNVVVEEELRGRGLGERMLEGALADLEDRGVETVRLYALGEAVSLYERVGFEAEGEAASLAGRGLPEPPGLEPATEEDVDELAAFDEAAFGASRRDLIATLAASDRDRGLVVRDGGRVRGYAFVKGGDQVAELGPAAADPGEPAIVEALVRHARRLAGDRRLEVGVRSENPEPRRLLEEAGFEEAFPATTMRWGADAHGGEPRRWLAVGGMAKG